MSRTVRPCAKGEDKQHAVRDRVLGVRDIIKARAGRKEMYAILFLLGLRESNCPVTILLDTSASAGGNF